MSNFWWRDVKSDNNYENAVDFTQKLHLRSVIWEYMHYYNIYLYAMRPYFKNCWFTSQEMKLLSNSLLPDAKLDEEWENDISNSGKTHQDT